MVFCLLFRVCSVCFVLPQKEHENAYEHLERGELGPLATTAATTRTTTRATAIVLIQFDGVRVYLAHQATCVQYKHKQYEYEQQDGHNEPKQYGLFKRIKYY